LLGLLIEAFSLYETVEKNLMLSDVDEGSNLILKILTPVATLIDTKQQSATTSFSTQVVTFSCHLWNRRDARVESQTHAKRNDC